MKMLARCCGGLNGLNGSFLDLIGSAIGLPSALTGGGGGGSSAAPITVSPNISTEVSPSISPIFQQQFQPTNSAATAGTSAGQPTLAPTLPAGTYAPANAPASVPAVATTTGFFSNSANLPLIIIGGGVLAYVLLRR